MIRQHLNAFTCDVANCRDRRHVPIARWRGREVGVCHAHAKAWLASPHLADLARSGYRRYDLVAEWLADQRAPEHFHAAAGGALKPALDRASGT